jgi:hypothetical protein
MHPIPLPISKLWIALEDIERLHEAHGLIIERGAATKAWHKDGSSIYTRSGLALLCASWEAFVEEVTEEALRFLIANVSHPDQLPLELRKKVAKELKEDRHELAVWKLAEDSWREVLQSRFQSILNSRLGLMNSPKSEKVRLLIEDVVGLHDVTAGWSWDGFSRETVVGWVDKFVTARGAVAHGKTPDIEIGCFSLVFFTELVIECSYRTCNCIREFLIERLNREIWPELKSEIDWKRNKDMTESLPALAHVIIFREPTMRAHYAVAIKDSEQDVSPNA